MVSHGRHGQNHHQSAIIVDTPVTNVWNLISGLTGADYDLSWSLQEGVYFSATGRSFYEQCFPSDSVHVGFSSHAVMYLSTRYDSPCVFEEICVNPAMSVIHLYFSNDATRTSAKQNT